ncbi:MAG: uracil-DNA glycosylase [Alphaproteobacteria bacterium]|nr:uracil-DNA glycosylase [Alphaproteobacteria bacterium]
MQISKDDIDILKLYEDSGVDESYTDKPYEFFSGGANIFANKVIVEDKKSDVNISILKAKQEAEKLVNSVSDLAGLKKVISEFKLNPLLKFASNVISGVGVENPKLLVITETPNTDEDRSGVMLSGPTGDMFKKILVAIKSSVETDTYTFPASPYRAPGGRLPTFEEMEISIPFIKKFIEILKPKVILCMGSLPVNALFGKNDAITLLRGKWLEYNEIPLMTTFSLSYLLNNKEAKKRAWGDLQLLLQKF